MLEAGAMRERVEFLALASVSDGQGGTIESWIGVRSQWARIRTARADERINAGQVDATVVYVVTVRYFRSFTPTTTHRLRYRGRIFEIKSAADVDELHVERDLDCVEVGT
jgi:SPP1 family predicted phage head-tail adaptor